LTAILGKRLTWQRECNGGGGSFIGLGFHRSGWLGEPGSLRAASWGCLFLTGLLSPLRLPKALAAATTTPPTPGSILKLSSGHLTTRCGAGRTACRGAVTPWGRLFFQGPLNRARLPILRFTALPARILAVPWYAFKVRGVFLLLHKIGDVEKRVALQA
jgi:hypothetical protein